MDLASLRRWWPTAVVAALLAVAALAAAHSTPRLSRVERPARSPGARPQGSYPTPAGEAGPDVSTGDSSGLPGWLEPLALGLLALLVVALLALVVWTVVRDQLRRRSAAPERAPAAAPSRTPPRRSSRRSTPAWRSCPTPTATRGAP